MGLQWARIQLGNSTTPLSRPHNRPLTAVVPIQSFALFNRFITQDTADQHLYDSFSQCSDDFNHYAYLCSFARLSRTFSPSFPKTSRLNSPCYSMDNSNYKLRNMAYTTGVVTPPETPRYRADPNATSTEECRAGSGIYSDEKKTSQVNLEQFSELVYGIIEHAVEEKIAEAIGPLRLNLNRLDRENSDFHEQNDTLSRQIDLHYKSIEKHNDIFDNLASAHARGIQATSKLVATQSGVLQATSENLSRATCLVDHLSQTVANLPASINQVVASSVQEQVQLAMQHVLAVQQPHHPTYYNTPAYTSAYPALTTNGWHSSGNPVLSGCSSAHTSHELLRHDCRSQKPCRRGSFKRTLARWFKCSGKGRN